MYESGYSLRTLTGGVSRETKRLVALGEKGVGDSRIMLFVAIVSLAYVPAGIVAVSIK